MGTHSAKRVPTATYRLQLHRGFTFRGAAACVDYLNRLGISDGYLSPVLGARAGSPHGYDVVDPSEINTELGGERELAELASELDARGMGVLLDIVPNHMFVAGNENPWWNDILLHGRASRFASFFDIDWPPEPERESKVVLPFLATSLDEVLAALQLGVTRAGGAFYFVYGELHFPMRMPSLPAILEPALRRVVRLRKPSADELRDLVSAVTASDEDERAVRERLARCVRVSPDVREAIDARLGELNRSPTELRALLGEQHYELTDWREAGRKGSYRRFFDVNELAAVRVEDDDVFRATHGKILDLVSRGLVSGLRVDHVDGLSNPEAYLERLPKSCYVVVEKILTGDERLRDNWSVEGTTGYELLNALNGLFVDPASESVFRERYAALAPGDEAFNDVVYDSKKHVLAASFGGEITRLVRLLTTSRAGATDPLASASREALASALSELAACFPVYRSYIAPDGETVSVEDEAVIGDALAKAKDRAPGELEPVLDAVCDRMLSNGALDVAGRELRVRFQQLTSTVMAKGLEDTALYRYAPLASLNEVGGEPDRFGVSVAAFHRLNRERQKSWPAGLSSTSTHDTKRSEDVRARLDVLSELGEAWWDAVSRWRELNGRLRPPELHPHDEYLLYQTIVGAWPSRVPDEAAYEEFVGRVQAYMRKASKEAKLRSSWTNPDEAYEEALSRFAASVLDTGSSSEFLEDLMRLLASILNAGFYNAVSQVLLKIASPGIPDFYQGSEMWDYSLVDPDNRRAVDFERRRKALAELDHAAAIAPPRVLVSELLDDLTDGRLKLFVTSRALRYRHAHPAVFSAGDHVPMHASGGRADHVVAFARIRDDEAVIVAAARYFTGLNDPPIGTVWEDTTLDLGSAGGTTFHDVLTGRTVRGRDETLRLHEAFRNLPFVMLERAGTTG